MEEEVDPTDDLLVLRKDFFEKLLEKCLPLENHFSSDSIQELQDLVVHQKPDMCTRGVEIIDKEFMDPISKGEGKRFACFEILRAAVSQLDSFEAILQGDC